MLARLTNVSSLTSSSLPSWAAAEAPAHSILTLHSFLALCHCWLPTGSPVLITYCSPDMAWCSWSWGTPNPSHFPGHGRNQEISAELFWIPFFILCRNILSTSLFPSSALYCDRSKNLNLNLETFLRSMSSDSQRNCQGARKAVQEATSPVWCWRRSVCGTASSCVPERDDVWKRSLWHMSSVLNFQDFLGPQCPCRWETL